MLKAIAHRIIIEPEKVEEMSKGGIAIPVLNKRAAMYATVSGKIVDIGPDAWKAFKPDILYAGLNVGDKVYIAKYAGKVVADLDNLDKDGFPKEYIVINDEDVVCKIV